MSWLDGLNIIWLEADHPVNQMFVLWIALTQKSLEVIQTVFIGAHFAHNVIVLRRQPHLPEIRVAARVIWMAVGVDNREWQIGQALDHTGQVAYTHAGINE